MKTAITTVRRGGRLDEKPLANAGREGVEIFVNHRLSRNGGPTLDWAIWRPRGSDPARDPASRHKPAAREPRP